MPSAENLHDQLKTGPASFPPLHAESRDVVVTAAAAYYLNRSPQTLRNWACVGGPIRPIRVHGRLGWPVSAIRKMLEVTA